MSTNMRFLQLPPYHRKCVHVLFAAMLLLSAVRVAHASTLKICADPNNLPFSNSSGQGFENHIADLVGQSLKEPIIYTWWAQRRGYVRNTIKAGHCDIWIGVATGVDMLVTTQPYYRSTYVFVARSDRYLEINSLDDPRLRQLQIAVQMVGDDANNTPPAHALADRGITYNVHGYMLYGDYNQSEPQRAIVDAVASGKVDVAIVWGPIAGYFAAQEPIPLRLTPVRPQKDGIWPMTFAISMGVRRGNSQLRDQLNQALTAEQLTIDKLLAEYHVPLIPLTSSDANSVKAKERGASSEQDGGKMRSIFFEH